MSEDAQVGGFVDKAQAELTAAGAQPGEEANKPRVPFQGGLILDRDQEDKMLDHAFARLAEVCRDNGRDQTINPTWWMNTAPAANLLLASQGLHAADTWMGKRARYDAMFLNDVSWRPWTMGPDNIFMSSNLAVPVVRRICRQMVARAKNMFFGSDPWFALQPSPVPEGQDMINEELIERIERFVRFKLDEAASKDDKGDAIKHALILGECAVKTNYVVRDQIFNTEAVALHNVDGEPMRLNDNSMIMQGDPTAVDGNGATVSAKDPTFIMPDAPIWQKTTINRRQVLFEGAKSEVIYYKDFVCPLTAKNVQEADLIAHLYDKAVMQFVDLVVKRGMVGDTPEDRIAAAQKMVTLIKTISDNDNTPKSAQTQELRPNENFTPQPGSATAGPVAEFAEIYMWYDANGDGIAENIMLIADRKNKVPIFYDHVANVTTDGLRPIEIIRINPVAGRWYGLGIMELFESYQTVTDLMVNRWNFSQSRSGRVDLWTPTNTLEGDRDPNLKMNWGATYTKKPGMKKEDVLETVYLTDTKFEQIKAMIEFFLQLLMNESGVANANDSQTAGLKSSDLATGIVSIQQAGDELFQPIIDDIKEPMNRLMTREIDVTLANMNPEEVFTYLNGDTMGIDRLTPQDVRGLKYKCKVTLTTMKNNQQVQMSAQAAALVEKYYMLPPQVQQHVAPFYRQQLRVLAPDCDPETTIVVMAMPPLGLLPGGAPGAAPGAPAAAAGAPQGGMPPQGSIGKKLGDAGAGGSTPFPAQLSQAPNEKTA